MLTKDAVKFYGNSARLARVLKIHRSAIQRWSKRVPLRRALKLQELSGGALKCDVAHYLEQE
jgi:hypothetical protein